jgi:hypothetical protein
MSDIVAVKQSSPAAIVSVRCDPIRNRPKKELWNNF